METLIKTLKIVGLSLVLLATSLVRSQNSLLNSKVNEGALPYLGNDAAHPCISEAEYARLDQEVSRNLEQLELATDATKNVLTTSFIWPLHPAVGFTQCAYHFIGAFVDQNTTSTAIQDFNCETNTYDGHHGTDIAIMPYGFYKMDNNQIEVVAAADGTIVQRADGNFDRNCASNSLTANSIIIQHADGSQALYWHMKKDSVTPKTVGQTVVAGEYLGVVGSSGSSTGPHLHFEVRSSSTSASYKDPYSGSCNLLNASSWWTAQRPHTEPTIVKVSVNTTDITLASCPNSDVMTESDTFLVPFQGAGLAAGYAKFYLFTRELPANSLLSMRILNPNGTVFNSWIYTLTTFYKTSYIGFSKMLPTVDGTYTFEATYNGISCSRPFTIVHTLGVSDLSTAAGLQLFPNPVHNLLQLQAEGLELGDYRLRLSTVTGQVLFSDRVTVSSEIMERTVSFWELPNGIYFLTLENNRTRIFKKIIKN